MTTGPTTVLLVDDDPLVRSGLAMMLGGDPDLEVVGQAGDGAVGVRLAARLRPRVVLMDVRMPVMDGLAATQRIRALDDPPEVIILTTFQADEYVLRSLAAGAGGFLLKDTPPGEIVAAIRKVAAGEPMLSPGALSSLIHHFAHAGGAGRDRARNRLDSLTERELEVAVAVGQGLSNADIAKTLHLSVPTVKAHIGRLFTKLDAENRVQVAICVHDAGLL